jgi:hypothetical protein
MGRSLAGAWSSPWESALVGALAAPAYGMVMKFNNPTSDKAPIAKKALVQVFSFFSPPEFFELDRIIFHDCRAA